MRKFTKKAFCILTAAAVTAGALSLAACGKNFQPVSPDPANTVTSNGGFVVATDEYYYFINGVEDYASDNTYGDVVKGALMRVKKADVKEKKNAPETVIPSLMVAGDTTAGIFIYGGRIYYATPNNVKSTTGETEKDYLDFKSAKTDGSDVKDILRLSDKSTQYRFVQGENGAVYLVYIEGKNLHSYNVSENKDTVLVKDGTFVFNDSDKTDPYIYYTMSVADKLDSDFPVSYKYNQIYRVRADATKGYDYKWDQEWLDKNNDGEAPYVNLGELVLDGVGRSDLAMEDRNAKTQFNPDAADDLSNCPQIGYVYTLQNYANGGIYYKRTLVKTPGSTVGSEGELFYLPASALGEGWNSVTGNDGRDMIANSTNLSKASSAALYYMDEAGHHYLYTSGTNIRRADVNAADGSNTEELSVAFDASGATLVSLDTTDPDYQYVYYTRSNNGALSVERAVYNGTADMYSNLSFGNTAEEKAYFESVKVLNVQHASGWYNYEVIDGNLFYANAESFGEALNYVYTVNLNKGDKLMNNEDIRALNKKYDSIFSSDKKEGYLEKVKDGEGGSNVSNALKYYFYTGESTLVWENIQDARDEGKTDGYIKKNLYSEAQQKMIAAFTGKESMFEGLQKSEDLAQFYDENGEFYFNVNYFTTRLGEMNEADGDSFNDYWKSTVLNKYVPVEEEESGGLAWWAWLLIALAIAAAVAGVGVGVYFYRKKHKQDAPKPERMRVDTTDDKTVDVYSVNAGGEETPAQADAAEESAESVEAEQPAEEPAEEAVSEEAEAVEAEEPAEKPQGENDPYQE